MTSLAVGDDVRLTHRAGLLAHEVIPGKTQIVGWSVLFGCEIAIVRALTDLGWSCPKASDTVAIPCERYWYVHPDFLELV